MTALNVAVARRRVLFVADELVTGGAHPLRGSKIAVIAHARAVIASAGHHLLKSELLRVLHAVPVGTTVADIAAEAPVLLRRLWIDHGLHAPSMLILAGVLDDGIAVYRLASPLFEALPLPSGAYLHPSIEPESSEASPSESAHESSAAAAVVAPADERPLTWNERTRLAVLAVRRQHRDQRVPIAGRVHSVLITPDCINTAWLDELPEPEALPA